MKRFVATLLFITLSGCVSHTSSSIFEGSKPIIDTKGVNMAQYAFARGNFQRIFPRAKALPKVPPRELL